MAIHKGSLRTCLFECFLPPDTRPNCGFAKLLPEPKGILDTHCLTISEMESEMESGDGIGDGILDTHCLTISEMESEMESGDGIGHGILDTHCLTISEMES